MLHQDKTEKCKVLISTDLGSLGFKIVCFLLPSGCVVTQMNFFFMLEAVGGVSPLRSVKKQKAFIKWILKGAIPQLNLQFRSPKTVFLFQIQPPLLNLV